MLSEIQIRFMEALSRAICGAQYELHIDNSDELRQFLYLADIQNVLPLICECIYESADLKKYPSIFGAYRKRAIAEFSEQKVRTAQFFDLYQFLINKGLEPVVVKGVTLRQLYPIPDIRPSVDEDFLIKAEEKFRYQDAVLDYGMELTEPDRDVRMEDEMSYVQKESGMCIEIHQNLLPSKAEAYADLNRFFCDVKSVYIETQGHTIRSLNPTDHLFFMICHSLKHFLHSGFGIRQICDIVLFSDCYAKEIDWERIYRQCHEIHADIFTRSMYQIGEKYLLKENRFKQYVRWWGTEEIDETNLLEDVLLSGIHGNSELLRLHSSNYTISAVIESKNKSGRKVSVWNSIFLPANRMNGRYQYLKKYPFLLPIAWIQRIISYLCAVGMHNEEGKDALESMKLGRERVELLREYRIID